MNETATKIILLTSTSQYDLSYKWSYYAALPTYITLMVLDLWILTSLIHYGIKTGKWSQLQTNNSEKLNSGFIYTSVIACSVLIFFYYLIFIIDHHNGYDENTMFSCNIGTDSLKVMYVTTVFTVNTFLWLRQRVFYTNMLVTTRFRKLLNVFSFSIIIIIFIGAVAGAVISSLPNDSQPSSIGCVYKPNGNLRIFSLYIAISIIVFGQASLMGLLLYGLVSVQGNTSQTTCKNVLCCHKNDSETENSVSGISRNRPTTVNTKTMANVHRIIQKTVIFAILSFAADTAVLTFDLLYRQPYTRRDLTGILACLAVFLNLFFLIFSFIPWREMITSPCRFECDWLALTSNKKVNNTPSSSV